MNSEKRETIMRAFARIQDYALARQKMVEKFMIRAAAEYADQGGEYKDFYTLSVRLPKELYQMEVLYNLGRSFHQVKMCQTSEV